MARRIRGGGAGRGDVERRPVRRRGARALAGEPQLAAVRPGTGHPDRDPGRRGEHIGKRQQRGRTHPRWQRHRPADRYMLRLRDEIGTAQWGWVTPAWMVKTPVVVPGRVLTEVGLQLPTLWPVQSLLLHLTAVRSAST
jgi:hypothetical protein